jgi:hypothetical protein
MTTKTTLLITFLLALGWQVQAQDTQMEEEPVDIPRKTWDAGTDLLWLINKNTLPATSVFVRYNVSHKYSLPGAIRLRVGIDLSLKDSITIYPPPKDNINHFAPFVRLGYEWQHRKGRYEFYYGADMQVSYSSLRLKQIVYGTQNYSYDGKFKRLEIGPVGFAGMKFFLSEHISFSAEASFNLIYRCRRDYSESYPYPGNPGDLPTTSKMNINELNVRFYPISVININYHF